MLRELYGAMQSERAGRGLLVTTGRYGKGAHDFVIDKEITLVDGANLLHLLQNHGHRVRIDPSETQDLPSSSAPTGSRPATEAVIPKSAIRLQRSREAGFRGGIEVALRKLETWEQRSLAASGSLKLLP